MNNMLLSPCKDCRERWVAAGTSCHATCERYIEYAAFRRKIRDCRIKEIDLYNALSDIRRAAEAARKR